jgi:CheY-like chemotaxis protein
MDAVPILIVDDYAGLRETVRLLLQLEGHIVYEAFNGYEALDYLRTSAEPLAVLLDWQMPGLSGLDVLHALASDAPQARRHAYILYTSADHPQDLLAQVPAGFCVAALSKFCALDDLLSAVKQARNCVQGKTCIRGSNLRRRSAPSVLRKY